ncbi:MAG: oxamate carbamoyltransferase subunit AllH family protein [Actinomycetota bacterium]
MRALGHRPQGRKKTGELVEQLITGLDVALRATGGAVTQLFDALAANDANRLSRAAHTLLGRGPGLTPEGDDLLAAASGTLIVVGRTCGLPPEVIPRLLHALLPADRHERTTALGATLLELASRGHLAEPVHPLLDLERNTDTAHARDVSKLLGIGGSTGRAYAIGVAATLLTLSSRTARDPKREP